MHSEAAFEATEVAQFDETLSDGEFLVAILSNICSIFTCN